MHDRAALRRFLVAVALLLGIGVLPTAKAQAPTPEENRTVRLNYVYAANLGFGGYSVGGLDTSVYTLPLEHTFPLGNGGWGLRVTLPIQLGIYNFRATDTNGENIALDQQSIAVVPRFELLIPIAPRVVLKPFVAGGAAHAFGVSDEVADAWIYTVGVRGIAQWQRGAYTLSLGAGALVAGDRPIGPGTGEDYSALQLGAELRRPLGFSLFGLVADAGAYVAGYHYPKPLMFSRFLQSPLRVQDQAEIGVTIGSATPFEFLTVSNPRLGVGFVFGDGLKVWRIAFGFPF